jgi:hypothetical protein
MNLGFTTTAVSSRPAWVIDKIEHFKSEDKGGAHHVYIDVSAEDGADARGTVSVRYGWEGMQPAESPLPLPTDKPPGEPACNVPIDSPAQKLWVEIADPTGAASDRIAGMECFYAYFVTFRKDSGQPVTAADVAPDTRRLSKKVKEAVDAA